MADLFDIAVARKLSGGSGGGGGGGSSDLSTAEVTTIGTSQIVRDVWLPLIAEGEGYAIIYAGTVNITSLNGPSGNTVTVPLYKGSMSFALPEGYSGTPTITGDATVDEYGWVIVTGDCTITI